MKVRNLKNSILLSKRIGLVYDVPNLFNQSDNSVHEMQLPPDSMSEWESQETINIIVQTWQELGYAVSLFPVDKNFLNQWAQNAKDCDVVHSLVEGFGSLAREAWIPSLCELTGVPCIGSSPFVHSICMNKNYVKLICHQLNIPTAQSYLVRKMDDFDNIEQSFLQKSHFIKPNGEGSGMGVDVEHSISADPMQTKEIVLKLLQLYPDGILLETYLPGAEYTTGIIGKQKEFLPVAQIEVMDGVYGFANKSKNYLSEKITFPQLSSDEYTKIASYSHRLFDHLGMMDMARFDWKCDDNGHVHFLEVNTLPGLSKIYSVLPLMAQEAGINYTSMLQIFFDGAHSRRNERNLWYAKQTQNHAAILL